KAQGRARRRGPAHAAAAGAADRGGQRARSRRRRARGRHAGRPGLRGVARRPAVAAAAQRPGAARPWRYAGPVARRARGPARTRRKPAHPRRARRAAVDHGLPLRGPRQTPADDPRDECPAARDGSHRALGPVQPWPPDLGALQPAGDRPVVPARTLTMRKQFTLGLALAGCALALAGCSGSPQSPAGEETMTPDPNFIAEEDAWGARRDESLRRPDGWPSLVGLHWIELKAHFIGSGATN